MRAREPDPIDARHVVTRAQQLAELGSELRREIAAPGVHVLAEECHLANAALREPRDLGDDLARAPALLAASNGRDDAVRADGVAPHRHLHPCLVAPLASQRKIRREVLVRAEATARDRVSAGGDPLAEVRDRARPEGDVDERVPLEDPLALGLRVAATDSDDDIGPLALQRTCVAEVSSEPRVRLLADRARVEHEDVGLVRSGCLAEPERLEHALDALRVVSVHLAAEGRDVVPAHRRRRVARPRSSLTARSAQRDRCRVSALLRHLDRATLADDDHLDLARILELILDLPGDLVREKDRAVVVDL